MSPIDLVWESDWRLFTKVCQDTIDLLVKGTAHTQMKVIGGKIMDKVCDIHVHVGCLTKSHHLVGIETGYIA